MREKEGDMTEACVVSMRKSPVAQGISAAENYVTTKLKVKQKKKPPLHDSKLL